MPGRRGILRRHFPELRIKRREGQIKRLFRTNANRGLVILQCLCVSGVLPCVKQREPFVRLVEVQCVAAQYPQFTKVLRRGGLGRGIKRITLILQKCRGNRGARDIVERHLGSRRIISEAQISHQLGQALDLRRGNNTPLNALLTKANTVACRMRTHGKVVALINNVLRTKALGETLGRVSVRAVKHQPVVQHARDRFCPCNPINGDQLGINLVPQHKCAAKLADLGQLTLQERQTVQCGNLIKEEPKFGFTGLTASHQGVSRNLKTCGDDIARGR